MVARGNIGSVHRIEFTQHSTRKALIKGDVIEALGVRAIDTVRSLQGEVERQQSSIV